MHEQIQIWGATDQGRTREYNEDNVFPRSERADTGQERYKAQVPQKGRLCVVADGMGGGGKGRTASQLAIEALLEAYYEGASDDPGLNLRAAVESANAAVYGWASQAVTGDAGTTVTAALIINNYAYIANVGDSRTYLFRGGGLAFKTKDHSLVQEWVDSGRLTPEQAAQHPDRNMITRSLGDRSEVDVDLTRQLLQPGDVLVLCSDGLSGLVSDQEIGQIATANRPQKAVQKLIDLANKRGGTDNISALVIHAPGKAQKIVDAQQEKRKLAIWIGSAGLVTLVLFAIAAMVILNNMPGNGQTGTGTTNTPAPAQLDPTATRPNAVASTATPEAGETSTPTPTPQAGETPASEPTSTRAPTHTHTPTATNTPLPTATHTPTPEPPKIVDFSANGSNVTQVAGGIYELEAGTEITLSWKVEGKYSKITITPGDYSWSGTEPSGSTPLIPINQETTYFLKVCNYNDQECPEQRVVIKIKQDAQEQTQPTPSCGGPGQPSCGRVN